MPSRIFDDSSGVRWEVFEVHRASDSPQAVTAGMERGWLAFVSSSEKRRLARYPADWLNVAVPELERLCAQARVAANVSELQRRTEAASGRPNAPPADAAGRSSPSTLARISGGQRAVRSNPEVPILRPAEWAEVEQAVREFAHEARTGGLPAVEAMVRLRSRLLERFPGDAHAARDMRRVRRWFVETYYFERGD